MPKATGKIILLDHSIVSALEGETSHVLSSKTRYMLLGILEQLSWRTRWTNGEDRVTEEQLDAIKAWAAQAALELMQTGGGSMSGIGDVWQDDDFPCKLWKELDGVNSIFADLSLCKPIYRQGQTGLEVSNDGGETWEGVGNAPIEPRDPNAANNRCLASANALNVLVTLHHEVCTKYSPGIPVLAFAAGIVAFIVLMLGGFAIAAVFASFASSLLLYSTALVVSSFTQEVQDELLCILYCASSEDTSGNVTFDFEQVQDAVQANSGLADIWNVIEIYLLIIDAYQGGGEGLNRAGSTTAITTAECECAACPEEHCRTFSFANGVDGWILNHPLTLWVGAPNNAIYGNDGATNRKINTYVDFPQNVEITRVDIYAKNPNAGQNHLELYAGSTLFHNSTWVSANPGLFSWQGSAVGNRLMIDMEGAKQFQIFIYSVTIWYTGIQSFGEDNC